MTFLTPGNNVSSMGGLITLEELTSIKNTRVPPPGFPPASGGGAVSHVAQMMALPQAGPAPAPAAAPGVNHVAQMMALPQAGPTPPPPAAAPGAVSHVAQMMALPQAGPTPAPPATRPGAVNHVAQMMALPQASPFAVPRRDFVPGELESARTLVATGQTFQLGRLGNGRAVPRRDFLPGELESARTLVATTSVGNVRARGFARGRRKETRSTPCTSEFLARQAAQRAYRNCARKTMGHTRTQVAAGVAEAGTNATTRASEGALLGMGSTLQLPNGTPGSYHGQYGRALPVKDLVPGELEHVAQMLALPQAQAFSLGPTLLPNGAGHYPGQYGRALPVKPLPIKDLVPGELEHAAQMLALPQAQAFSLSGLGNDALPVSDLVPGELMRAGGNAPLPVGDLVPGELVSGRTLVDHAQGFAGLGNNRALPIRDLVPGEYERASRMIAHRQGFGDWIPYKRRGPEPRGGQQGTWLSPAQVPAADLESAAALIAAPQNFGGLGNVGPGRPVPRRDFVPGEIMPASSIPAHRQSFGGMSDWIPYTKGEPEPKGGTQGTWLSPDQVPAWDRESAAALIAQPQSFGGLGNARAVPRADFVPGEIESAAAIVASPQNFGGLGNARAVPRRDFVPGELRRPSWITGHRQAFGGLGEHLSQMLSLPQASDSAGAGRGRAVPIRDFVPGEIESAAAIAAHSQSFSLGATGDNVRVGQLDLSPICDPVTGQCISYATPQEIRSAIGRTIGGQSALRQRQVQLPAFYSHPELGPWGVDPRAAYQYWWAQQAAMQRAAVASPLSIWGSPGSVTPTPPLQPSPIAQTAAFDPYNDTYPSAGAAVERF